MLSVRTNPKNPYKKMPDRQAGTYHTDRYMYQYKVLGSHALRLCYAEIHFLPYVFGETPYGGRQPHLEVSRCFSCSLCEKEQPAIDVLKPAKPGL